MSRPKKFNFVNYTARDFGSLRTELTEYARKYYPETVKDFGSNSFAGLLVDTVSYAGDMLSFYLDYQVNESFLETAVEYGNILKLANQLGYKPKPAPSAVGTLAFFVIVPANVTGLGPQTNYIPILKRNTVVNSQGGGSFVLTEDVDFSDPRNEVAVARVNPSNGLPVSYAIKAYGTVVSGVYRLVQSTVGSFVKFRRVALGSSAVSEVITVTDSEGNEYYEVEYLSQDIIYRSELNVDPETKQQTPNLMIPMAAPRRYIIERTQNETYLIFGQGTDSDFNALTAIEPKYVSLNRFGRNYVTDEIFDPKNLIENDSMGICPTNTTLTIVFRENQQRNTSIGTGQIRGISNPIIDYKDPSLVTSAAKQQIGSSLEAYNEEPIESVQLNPTIEDIRIEAKNYYAAQSRAVTAQDYESLCYRMPPQFGAVFRARAVRDPDSLKRNINLYVLSKNSLGQLQTCNTKTKQNLKNWISNYRMLNDTVDILNGRVVNFGIEFEIVASDMSNANVVLTNCINKLTQKFIEPHHLGQPLNIFDIYGVLNNVEGVIDVVSAKFVNKKGSNYSTDTLNFTRFTTPDGRRIIPPENVAFEMRYGFNDIMGRAR